MKSNKEYTLTHKQSHFLGFTISQKLYDLYDKNDRLDKIFSQGYYSEVDKIYLNRLRNRYITDYPKWIKIRKPV